MLSPWLHKVSTPGNDVVYNLPYAVVTELSEIVAVSVESQKVFPGGVGYQVNILLHSLLVSLSVFNVILLDSQDGWKVI